MQPGAAICNSGGSIGLAGGTITGNQSEGIVNEAAEITGGAIYSLGEIRVSGAVIVKDNKDDGLNDNSIVLGGDNACIAAIGQLAETADLQVRRSDAAAGKIIVKVGTDRMVLHLLLWRIFWHMFIIWTLQSIPLTTRLEHLSLLQLLLVL